MENEKNFNDNAVARDDDNHGLRRFRFCGRQFKIKRHARFKYRFA